MKYNEMATAAAFTLFINNGGLRIPSQCVYNVSEYAEKIFKESVEYYYSHFKRKQTKAEINHACMPPFYDGQREESG